VDDAVVDDAAGVPVVPGVGGVVFDIVFSFRGV
jgi:hypothetical protein